jgi:deoxyribodipyrimidine photolyase-related protein
MSDYCRGCRFHPQEATGENACPVTTLYWDFLDRHASRFRDNRPMVFQIKHLEKKQDELPEIRRRAARLKERLP